MEETKWCPRCEAAQPISEFYLNRARPDGLSGCCVVHQRLANVVSHKNQRRDFIKAMGNQCEVCAYSDSRALQVDHVNGDGHIEEISRGGTTFYKKVLANRDRYMLLCANCNQIKKYEQNETVGNRVYSRQVPTERTKGIGRGNAPAQRAALARARTPEHQAAAARAKKGKANPKLAESRRGTKLVDGHWVRLPTAGS